mgnify:CR=1 FL=1
MSKNNICNLFVYGTLMDPEIYQLVTEQKRFPSPSVAIGFKVLKIKNAVFPGMIIFCDGKAYGALYHDISEKELEKLDNYEDDFYERIIIECYSEDKQITQAWAYIVPERNHDVLSSSEWHFPKFRDTDRDSFIKELKEYFL